MLKNLFRTNHSSATSFSILILRIGIAVLMLTHGLPKLDKFAEEPVQFLDFLGMGTTLSLGLAIFAEVVCSILVLIGLGTRLAVIPLAFTMLIAITQVLADDPFARKELPVHYLLVYIVLFITGSGKFSLDRVIFQRKYSRSFN